jgi:hypothetical protein
MAANRAVVKPLTVGDSAPSEWVRSVREMAMTCQINLTIPAFRGTTWRLQVALSWPSASPIARALGLRTGETSRRSGRRSLFIGRQGPHNSGHIALSAFLRTQAKENAQENLRSSEPRGTSSRRAKPLCWMCERTQNAAATWLGLLCRSRLSLVRKSPLSRSCCAPFLEHAQWIGCRRPLSGSAAPRPTLDFCVAIERESRGLLPVTQPSQRNAVVTQSAIVGIRLRCMDLPTPIDATQNPETAQTKRRSRD